MIRIELSESDTATALGVAHKARGMTGPIGPLVRELIAGNLINPNDLVNVYRDGTKCFEDMSAEKWADLTSRESILTSAKFYKYVPFDGFHDFKSPNPT